MVNDMKDTGSDCCVVLDVTGLVQVSVFKF